MASQAELDRADFKAMRGCVERLATVKWWGWPVLQATVTILPG